MRVTKVSLQPKRLVESLSRIGEQAHFYPASLLDNDVISGLALISGRRDLSWVLDWDMKYYSAHRLWDWIIIFYCVKPNQEFAPSLKLDLKSFYVDDGSIIFLFADEIEEEMLQDFKIDWNLKIVRNYNAPSYFDSEIGQMNALKHLVKIAMPHIGLDSGDTSALEVAMSLGFPKRKIQQQPNGSYPLFTDEQSEKKILEEWAAAKHYLGNWPKFFIRDVRRAVNTICDSIDNRDGDILYLLRIFSLFSTSSSTRYIRDFIETSDLKKVKDHILQVPDQPSIQVAEISIDIILLLPEEAKPQLRITDLEKINADLKFVKELPHGRYRFRFRRRFDDDYVLAKQLVEQTVESARTIFTHSFHEFASFPIYWDISSRMEMWAKSVIIAVRFSTYQRQAIMDALTYVWSERYHISSEKSQGQITELDISIYYDDRIIGDKSHFQQRYDSLAHKFAQNFLRDIGAFYHYVNRTLDIRIPWLGYR